MKQTKRQRFFNVIQELAIANNYSFVFDKTGSVSILYSDPRLDISDDVLDEVGTVMQTIRREDRTR